MGRRSQCKEPDGTADAEVRIQPHRRRSGRSRSSQAKPPVLPTAPTRPSRAETRSWRSATGLQSFPLALLEKLRSPDRPAEREQPRVPPHRRRVGDLVLDTALSEPHLDHVANFLTRVRDLGTLPMRPTSDRTHLCPRVDRFAPGRLRPRTLPVPPTGPLESRSCRPIAPE